LPYGTGNRESVVALVLEEPFVLDEDQDGLERLQGYAHALGFKNRQLKPIQDMPHSRLERYGKLKREKSAE